MARETILEVGAEGGSLTLEGERMADGSWRFSASRNEMAIYESFSEEDRGTPEAYLQQSGYVTSLQEAIKIWDKYPWIKLMPRNVHPEFFNTILAEVRERGGELEETRWRELLRNSGPIVVNLFDEFSRIIRTELVSFEKETAGDFTTVTAVAATTMDRAYREEEVRKWLNYSKALRFFPAENIREIAKRVIEFADHPRQANLHRNRILIIEEYERLKEKIQEAAPRGPRTGNLRDVTSLTSKALWCCYPEDVPIYDDYAVRALQVIGRLFRIYPEAYPRVYGGFPIDYGHFVDVWLQLYQRAKPVIDQSHFKGYEIRVLDRLLWHLGQPTFDLPAQVILREFRPVGILRPDGSIQSDLPELQELNSIWQKEGIWTMCISNKSTAEITVDGAKFVKPSESIGLVVGSLREMGYEVAGRDG